MKNKIIFLLLGSAITLSLVSFTSLLKDDVAPQTEPTTTRIPTDEESVFSKEQKCFGIKGEVMSEISELTEESNTWNERFIDIFYSPNFDACIYLSEETSDVGLFNKTSIKRLMRATSGAGTEPIMSCRYVSFRSGQTDAYLEGLFLELENDCDEFDEYLESIR